MSLMKRMALSVAVLILGLTAAHADPILTGSTSGPDSSFSINFSFTNASTAGETITSMSLDGSTATAFPILWDSIGTLSGQTAVVAGVDTQLVTFNFTSIWDPTEMFSLSTVDPDGDPGPASVDISQLAGVQVTAMFSGGLSRLYEFVDDPAPNAGLVLTQVSSVPEPATLALLGIALAGLGFSRRRKLH